MAEKPLEFNSQVFPVPHHVLTEVEFALYRLEAVLTALKHYSRLQDDRHGNPEEIVPLLLTAGQEAVGDALAALERASALENARRDLARAKRED